MDVPLPPADGALVRPSDLSDQPGAGLVGSRGVGLDCGPRFDRFAGGPAMPVRLVIFRQRCLRVNPGEHLFLWTPFWIGTTWRG